LEASQLIYLYGIAPGTAPDPDGLRGLEEEPVRLLRAAGLAAIVSEVPAEDYAEAPLDARMTDLAWVGLRGLAHERVLNWFVDRGPVIPLAPFSIHADEARVRERLESRAADFERTLQSLAGARAWGVRVRRTPGFPDAVARTAPALAALEAERAAASPGRRYLLAKRRDALVADEVRAAATRIAREAYGALEPMALRARRLPVTAPAAGDGHAILLDAAFLVADDAYESFQQRLSEVAAAHADGLEWEFTGPWPAYHFVEP
jgi:hypothetical protein